MNRKLSLLFACLGVLLLVCVGLSLGAERPWLALLFLLLSILEIGLGFILKAKLGKH